MASRVEEASFDLEMDDIPLEPPSERLAPVGAPNDSEDEDDDDISFFKSHFGHHKSFDDSSGERLQKLEEEQEQLNSSLLALTTHFAQVQFKLTQVTQAPADDKETLLKQLEDFAFRGCPDLRSFQAANSAKSRTISTSVSAGRTSPLSSITDGSAGLSRRNSNAAPSEDVFEDHEKIILLQREKQQELILQLKQQLEELESYAFECGADITPHSVLVEKQKVIIDELRSKVNLDLNDMNHMSIEELKGKVDNAIGQITQPAKAREQLVNQLKTQIVDLERFIEYLQDGSDGPFMAFPQPSHRCTCDCPTHGRGSRPVGDGQSDGETEQLKSDQRNPKNISDSTSSSTSRRGNIRSKAEEEERRKKLNAAKRTLQMLQMFTVAQFGCGTGVAADIRASRAFSSSPSNRGEEFIAMVDRLESVVNNILAVASAPPPPLPPTTPAPSFPSSRGPRSRHSSAATVQSSEIYSPADQQSELLVNLVRKELYKSIVEILLHGLIDGPQTVTASKSSQSWGLLGCFPVRSSSLYYGATVASGGRDGPASSASFHLHPWLLFVKYYELKGGKEYNESPARKLSDAFGLDIVNGQSITAKHVLLSGIHEILTTHAPLKRSLDSQFKAFICLALNQKKLTPWIRLVMRTPAIVDRHFAVWSFMTKTNGDDLFKNLEKLKPVDFHLPVDMAVRSFRNINDAF